MGCVTSMVCVASASGVQTFILMGAHVFVFYVLGLDQFSVSL